MTMRDRSLARTFLETGADYEEYRPGFPDAVAEAILETAGPGVAVALDLGAGTGKFTRVLAPHVGRVIAVDPSEQMLAQLQRLMPSAEALVGSAENIPLPDNSVGLVTVAQAFHWFDPEPACAEIARVLRPDGVLALLGNGPDAACTWDVACSAISHGRESLDSHEMGIGVDTEPPVAPGFEAVAEHRIRWEEPLPRAHYLKRWTTVSRWLAADTTGRNLMMVRMASVLDESPQTQGRDVLPLTHITSAFVYRQA